MILTVTPNPSLDRTLTLDRLARGEVLRADTARVDPGGKGINVSMALAATSYDTRAVVPVGGHEGVQLIRALDAVGIGVIEVPVTEAVRTNVTLAEPDGTVTKINAPGPRLTVTELDRLTSVTAEQMGGARWVVGSGSLPPGAPTSFFADLVDVARAEGIRIAIDSSGPALAAAVAAGPDLIKPNVHELAELFGAPLDTLGDVVTAAERIRTRGVGTVVASLGADGAVLVTGEGAWHATPPRIVVRSAVGAGDALLAGLVAADPLDAAALRRGTAYGAGAASLAGTQFADRRDLDLEAVTLTGIDTDRRLTERGGTR